VRRALVLLLAAVAAGASAAAAQDARRSGYAEMGPALRAMQDDDAANPASLWVLEGSALWDKRDGAAQRACADCHGAPETMQGVAARYPVFDAKRAGAVDLAGRIEECRTERQQAPPFGRETRPLLALEALVARQSRGVPLTPDPALAAFAASGRTLWQQRIGQLDLSCAQCHDARAGLRLGGTPIPQGHATAYPIYRLEWQGLGSLQRRLRNCMTGVRAAPYAFGSDEYLALEAYLAQRSAGMLHEGPGVRP
jgi:L-cysteine S-thiosulfotransferase